MVLREAGGGDEDALWPLALALATSSVPTRRGFHLAFEAVLRDPQATVLVALDDGQIIGYVHVLTHAAFHADGNIAWVEELLVSEERRGSGIGRLLMSAAEEWAQETAQAVYVALATRRAATFYKTVGYVESATYLKKALTRP